MAFTDISIVIPNYNCLPYLPRCLESIRQQDLTSYEVIVVDDGSTDGSIEYLQELANSWQQLVLLQQQRQGPGAARNLAAQYSTSCLLAFLDADDWWAEHKLQHQIKFHKANPDVGLSFTDYQHIEEQTHREVIRCFDYWPEFSSYLQRKPVGKTFERLVNPLAMLLAENVVGTSSVVVQRSAFLAVQGFDVSLPSASDWDLWLKLSKVSSVGFSRQCSMFYLQRQGSVSTNYNRRFQAVDIILNRHLPDISSMWQSQTQTALVAREVARHEMLVGDHQAFRALLSAIRAWLLKPSLKLLKTIVRDMLELTRLKQLRQ